LVGALQGRGLGVVLFFRLLLSELFFQLHDKLLSLMFVLDLFHEVLLLSDIFFQLHDILFLLVFLLALRGPWHSRVFVFDPFLDFKVLHGHLSVLLIFSLIGDVDVQ